MIYRKPAGDSSPTLTSQCPKYGFNNMGSHVWALKRSFKGTDVSPSLQHWRTWESNRGKMRGSRFGYSNKPFKKDEREFLCNMYRSRRPPEEARLVRASSGSWRNGRTFTWLFSLKGMVWPKMNSTPFHLIRSCCFFFFSLSFCTEIFKWLASSQIRFS